jgi:branched-chain amino acid transport system ATP-binding protein
MTTVEPTGLSVSGLAAGYSDVPVVSDVSLRVNSGEVVALLGPNGAGKSTTLRAIAGLLRGTKGDIEVGGVPLKGPAHKRCRDTVGLVLEGRSVFASLTTEQNLSVAGVSFAAACDLFPLLAPLGDRRAGLLSGGEQQMVALARAVLRNPTVLMIDELSLGLAPMICTELYESLAMRAASLGIAILIVEQHVRFAAMVANRGYVLNGGRIVLHLDSGLRGHERAIEDVYLGVRTDVN